MAKKCIVLARVSSDKQSYEEQVKNLVSVAKKDGYTERNIIVINNVESAIKLKEEQRLGLNEMKDAIYNDKSIDCVYVREVSRIGRRYDVLTSIKSFFVTNKIQLVVCGDSRIELLDNNRNVTLLGGIMFEIACQMAAQEMADKQVRFKQGKAKAVKENKVIGSRILFGYTKDENGVIILDEEKADIVRYVFNAAANDNMSTPAIYKELLARGDAKTYQLPSGGNSFIWHIITSEAYKGGRSKTNLVFPFNYPAIVDEDVWQRANDNIKARNIRPYISKYVLYAKGLVKCDCGHTLQGNVDSNCSYRCVKCGRVVNLNVIEHIAWSEAKEIKMKQYEEEPEKNKQKYSETIEANSNKIASIKLQIKDLDTKLSRAYKGYVMGGINESDYNNIVKTLNKERNALDTSITNLETTNARLKELIRRQEKMDSLEALDAAAGGLQAITDDNERRKIVQETIGKILLSDFDGGILATIYDKNGIASFHKYLYRPSSKPKTYIMYHDSVSNKLEVWKEITDEIEKRYKRKRYEKRCAVTRVD